MNLITRKGNFVFPDGSVYDGEYSGTFKHGKGVYTFPDGECYDGTFNKDIKQGYGIYRWPDGRRYEGRFDNDAMNGQGKYYWEDGTCYEGSWVENERHGNGKFLLENGKRVVCDFDYGKLIGETRIYDIYGNLIERMSVEDRNDLVKVFEKTRETYFTKHGTSISADGSKYVGEHDNGKMNGRGIYAISNGDKYIGNLKDNKKEGLGSYYWHDGRKYVGEFKDDRPHGNGHLVLSDNESITADFIDGYFVNNRKGIKVVITENMDIMIDRNNIIGSDSFRK
ncbi:MAG: hypothetical protein PHN99_03110 [Eubacteriales bacterium]|jgi:hypothetical protein|nr:hypothetical protein [Eubacteriales bacterium]MDD4327567.1 hypothetical protein [Eubacteriales bacterium]MDD4717085.1 hypothetical protein [Eubacteriales bacterium]